MDRNSMVFYRSFYEAMEELNPEVKANVFDAIMQFSLNGKELDLSGISKTVFILIKPQLAANIKRYENGKQPKRPRSSTKQSESKEAANENENENVNKKPSYFMTAEDVQSRRKFVAPLLTEVENFFTENGYKVETARDAFKYYSEGNWKDSRGHIVKNWKQKMRGVWFKEENKIATKQEKQVYSAPTKYRPA